MQSSLVVLVVGTCLQLLPFPQQHLNDRVSPSRFIFSCMKFWHKATFLHLCHFSLSSHVTMYSVIFYLRALKLTWLMIFLLWLYFPCWFHCLQGSGLPIVPHFQPIRTSQLIFRAKQKTENNKQGRPFFVRSGSIVTERKSRLILNKAFTVCNGIYSLVTREISCNHTNKLSWMTYRTRRQRKLSNLIKTM